MNYHCSSHSHSSSSPHSSRTIPRSDPSRPSFSSFQKFSIFPLDLIKRIKNHDQNVHQQILHVYTPENLISISQNFFIFVFYKYFLLQILSNSSRVFLFDRRTYETPIFPIHRESGAHFSRFLFENLRVHHLQ